MNLDLAELNWLAIIVAALATFFLGGLWYTALFGKAWQKAYGFSDEKLAQMRKDRPPPVFFGTMIVCYVIIAFVTALLVQAAGVESAAGGALLGLLLWIGIAATVKLTDHIASDHPMSAYGIDAVYQLIYLVMIGAIIGGWR